MTGLKEAVCACVAIFGRIAARTAITVVEIVTEVASLIFAQMIAVEALRRSCSRIAAEFLTGIIAFFAAI